MLSSVWPGVHALWLPARSEACRPSGRVPGWAVVMLRGLVQQYDRYEMRCEITSQSITSTHATAQVVGTTVSTWAPDQTTTQTAIGLQVRRYRSGGGYAREFTLSIPALALSSTVTDATDTTPLTTSVRINGLQIYQDSNRTWRVRYTSIEWYVGGSLQSTTMYVADLIGSWPTAAGIPLVGCPPAVGASAGSGIAPVYPPVPSLTALDQFVECDVVGGWRFRYRGEGSDSALPVTAYSRIRRRICGEDLPNVVGGSDTWSVTAHAEHGLRNVVTGLVDTYVPCPPGCVGPGFTVRSGQVDLRHSSISSTGWAWPDIGWAAERILPEGTACLVERGGMPRVTQIETWGENDCSESPGSPNSTTYEHHPRYDREWATIGDVAGALEEPLSRTMIAPASALLTVSRLTGTWCEVISGTCAQPVGDPEDPPPPIDCYANSPCVPALTRCCGAWSVSWWCEDRTSATGLYTDFHHPESAGEDPYSWLVRLTNTWGSRLHQYSSWFPADRAGGDPVGADEWQLYSARANPSDYWAPIGTQWLFRPGLSSADGRETRTDLCTELVDEGFGGATMLSRLGRQGAYLGCARFMAVAADIPASYTYTSASSSAWSATGGTLTFGADITVNGTGAGAGEVVVDLDLAYLGCAPYWWGLIAGLFEVDWDPANLDSVTVQLVGDDGSEVDLGTAPGTYARISGPGTVYAGDWGRQYAPGFDATDVGTDSLGTGDSAAVAGSAERLTGLQLLPGRSAAKLRLRMAVTDRAIDCTLHYPVLHAPVGEGWSRPLAHRLWALLWPNGAGVLVGGLRYWDDAGDAFLATGTAPAIDVLDRPYTLLDALCLRRELLETRSRTDGLDTEISTEFVSGTEYTATEERKSCARSVVGIDKLRRTRAWWYVPPDGDRVVMCGTNSYREVPATVTLPVRRRDLADLTPDGEWGGYTYLMCNEPRRLIAHEGRSIDLRVGGTVWSSPASMPVGWQDHRHSHPVDNTEGASAQVRADGVEHALVSPWHGYFWAPLPPGTIGGVAADVGLDRLHVVAWIDGGDVVVRIEDHALSLVRQILTGITATAVAIRLHRFGRDERLYLYTVESGTAYRRISTDLDTFGAGASLGGAVHIASWIGFGGTEYVYRIDGSGPYDIVGRRYDAQGTALEPQFTAVTGVDNTAFSVTGSPIAGGRDRIVLRFSQGGALTRKTSLGGVTFT